MKLKNNQSGVAHLAAILAVVVVVAIGFVGLRVWDTSKNKSTEQTKTSKNQPSTTTNTGNEQPQLKKYTVANERLTFSYNPKITTIDDSEKPSEANDLYFETVKAKTGSVTLSVKAGISGIGGGPACSVNERNTCVVVNTLKSTFLKELTTYRLIKASQAEECGYSGVPACDVIPLTTSFILDTYDKTDAYGPCCGTITKKARNTGQKAKVTGSLLISVVPDKEIANKDLLTNTDFLNTVKIIESMQY